MRHRWNKAAICAAIRKLHQKDAPLNSWHIQQKKSTLYRAACVYYRNWGSAVTAAGLSYKKVRKRQKVRSWSKKKIIRAIKKRIRAKRSINGFAVYKEDRGLYLAAKRHFGLNGWRKALHKTGVSKREIIDPRLVWTKENVIHEIRRLYTRGTPLYGKYLVDHSNEKLVSAGKKVFGSWMNAIQASGFRYENVRAARKNWWTKQRVLRGIRKLNRGGMRLNSKAIQQSHGDLFGAAIKFFGSWSNAVTAVGIKYRRHCRVWSSKAWLRNLKLADMKSIERQVNRLTLQRLGGQHAAKHS